MVVRTLATLGLGGTLLKPKVTAGPSVVPEALAAARSGVGAFP